ncbi:preprotein translocase subunit YajC [Kineococcus xinjiangensis]|uniref:Preprotein translocase subunit YajC n=1 Tax=Kineococcus xinjiangensis TaxID=512762 RepID=A0A2S6IPE4_9ACTN|nr:preprotein translocase subunit YajC [Kineococcus xinjiangensis]PPK95966.1 preprotein translocase subunit YajC [Kineococcus xinjiangensis]
MDPQLIFLLLMMGLLFFMFSRTRKQQRAQLEMQNSLGPGAEVMTTSGLIGRIVAIEGEEMVLEIAPGVRTRWNRRAVARVTTSDAQLGGATPAGLDLGKRGPAAGSGDGSTHS